MRENRKDPRETGNKEKSRKIADTHFTTAYRFGNWNCFLQSTVGFPAELLSRLLHYVLSVVSGSKKREQKKKATEKRTNTRENKVETDRNDEKAEREHRIPLQ